jgi:hypothetical protein
MNNSYAGTLKGEVLSQLGGVVLLIHHPCIVSMSDHESFSLIALMQPNP